MFPHGDQVILFPHEDNCIQGIFHMPPWPNFPPWPCLDSQLPSNTELSLLCHNDESGRTLRLRTTCLTSFLSKVTSHGHKLEYSDAKPCQFCVSVHPCLLHFSHTLCVMCHISATCLSLGLVQHTELPQ